MMRILLLFVSAVLIGLNGFSQAVGTRVDYLKTQQDAAVIEIPCTAPVAENAIKDYMAKKGYKGSSFKDFMVFRSAKLDSAASETSDLYFRVAPKSRQVRDVVLVTLLPAAANENILTRTTSDTARVEASRNFLNQLAPYVGAHNVNVQARTQEDALRVLQKKKDRLVNDQSDLEKRVRNLQSDIDQNKKDQLKLTQQIQANIYGSDDDKVKAKKKLNSQMDSQSSMEKKLRKVQADLDQNKIDQTRQQEEIDKAQQVLNAIRAKQAS